MKKYKIKQSLTLTLTVASVTAKVIPAGTILYENKYCYARENKFPYSVIWDKEDVENNLDLFELVTEENDGK